MTIKELTEKLSHIEKKLDVNDWIVQSIQIWPIIRFHSLLYFKSENYNKEIKPLSEIKCKSLEKLKLNRAYQKLIKTTANALKSKNEQSLIFTLYTEHNEKLEGKKYNRLVDPYIQDLKDSGRTVQKILIDSGEGKDPLYFSAKELDLNKVWFFDARLFQEFPLIDKVLDKFPFTEIEEILQFKINKVRLRNDIRSVLAYKRFFQRLFKKVDSKVIYYTCYYRNSYFGLTSAAREAGIKTVDLQHGKQGKFHPMYSHFGKIPEGGYEILPDIFWNWGNESVENIKKHRNRNDFHVPVCGGNRFTAMFEGNIDRYLQKEELSFLKKLKNDKKVILFALQPPIKGNSIPDFINELITENRSDCFWLLRKHPLHEDTLADQLAEKYQNVDTGMASSILLYPLLKYSNITITRWSTVCYEGEVMNNNVVIIDPIGKELYLDEINDKRFDYAESAGEFKNILRRNAAKEKNADFISVSDLDMKKAIEIIYG